MNELMRMAYLDAMGIDCYVSRGELPGAAATQRLAIVRAQTVAPANTAPNIPESSTPGAISMPRIDVGSRRPRQDDSASPAVPPAVKAPSAVPRFSLAAIICDGWLWLEDLEDRALAREQVQLIQGMSRALARIVPPPADWQGRQPVITQFDWPTHNNQQLDQGEDAARAGVAGFIGRKLEQHHCRGLVLLGTRTRERVISEALGQVPVGTTPDTLSMLADPALKKRAWMDLLTLAAHL